MSPPILMQWYSRAAYVLIAIEKSVLGGHPCASPVTVLRKHSHLITFRELASSCGSLWQPEFIGLGHLTKPREIDGRLDCDWSRVLRPLFGFRPL